MPDLGQMASDLRGLPDQALQSELQNPTGVVPSYLVLAEAQRRQLMRQAAQKQQAQGQSGSVLDDVVRNMMAQQPVAGPPAPAGMVPPRQGQAPMPGALPPSQMRMASGGALRMADGGGADDDSNQTALGPIVDLGNVRTPGVMRPSSSDDVDDLITKYSTQYNVDPNMARAIMGQESGGNQRAVSNKGAIGRFQIMPGTARELGIDPHDPEQNIEGGIRYFRNMLDRYGNDPRLALAAYNAGPGAVDQYGGRIPPYEQTQKYVPAVLDRYNRLNQSTPRNISRSASQFLQAANQAAPQATPGTGAADTTATPAETANAAPGQAFPGIAPGVSGMPQSEREQIAGQLQPSTGEAARTADQDQTTPTFTATGHSGRIHQMIDDQQKVIDDIRDRIGKLPDPYGPENMETMKKIAPAIYGVPPNYLDTLSQQADIRAATVNQLQNQILQRYQNPSPWEFLAQVGAGMGASHQLSMPMAFAEGVGRAWQARDADQQRQMQDYDALEKMREGIYNNVESERGRMGQTLAGLLEHQAGVTQSNRNILEQQLKAATGEQDKLKKMLIPTNKLEAFYNPWDYDQDQRDLAAKAMQQLHPGWNKGRMDEEANSIQLLHSLGDDWTPSGQYGSARDQVLAKHPDMASQIAKPLAPAAQPLDPKSKLIQTTYLSGRQFVDGRNYKGKMADQVQAQVDATPGVTYLGKDQAESLDNIEDAQRGFDSMERSMLGYLPKDSTGHILANYLTVPLSQWTQASPAIAAWGAWRAQAIAQLRAAAGSKGLRINEAEIRNAVENDVPLPTDTIGTAMTRLAIMRRTIQNQEDSLFHTRGKVDPAPQIPVLYPDGMTLGYIPADQRNKALAQGYKLVQ